MKTNRFSASQEIPRILWNPKVHYRIRKCPPPVPILNLIKPVHALIPNFLNIHFNIILSFRPGSSKWSLSLSFPTKAYPLPHTCYMSRLSHSSRFDHPNNIWQAVQIIKLLIMYFSPLTFYFIYIT